ncbi:cytochrome b/b6 domain-containing protein [Mesoterricola sediminis]|uniref:Cytochrome b561 bacterial/Ni-hydrogenase domain-containing protein n=1 Tax=Mesoterricola sediminis TaxID=2927980 RepID=A0AA48GQ89_9BACT|nr:cytochrome b/b6 domain-containing protein [Mesoterricola sediminis]BDU75579.1 hypothetical protein METESE_05370 [Mesoterricola sediminis]
MPHPTPDAAPLERQLVWDWPTRILHLALAGLFTVAFAWALLAPEHSPAFVVHSALGLVLGAAVLLRLGWGLVGSRPSRFSAFLHSPAALVRYVRDAARGVDRPTAGHNPGAGYAAWAMFLLPLGLVGTGLAMGRGLHAAEEVHGALAYALLGVVGLHLLGLAWHTRRHREAIALSMVHGRRRIPAGTGIAGARPVAGILVALGLGAVAFLVARGLDPARGTLTLPGGAGTWVLKADKGGDGAPAAPGHGDGDDD